MGLLDWLIVVAFLIFIGGVAIYTTKFTRSVSDFLAANRCAGRYLLTMAQGMVSLGSLTVMANFEKYYVAGFPASWWVIMITPVGMVIALSGFISYRYRETRAMSMAQFFEMRYSRRFRIFSGMVAWFSGVINYGIFPMVTGRFIIYFTGLPERLQIGSINIPTLAVVMFVMLAIAVSITLCGGQIAVMLSDFIQSQFVAIVFLLIIICIFNKFSWEEIVETLKTAPQGKSMLNPYQQSKVKDFNIWFFAIICFNRFYNFMAWQGQQGYYCSAKSPHEAKMANILGQWRGLLNTLIMLMIPIAAWVLMHSPAHAVQAEEVSGVINGMNDLQMQKQMLVPVVLSKILPAGVLGLFTAAMIAASISTDDTYLHSWGSIFIQDVLMPLRRGKKQLSPKTHIWLLRGSIIGVAAFAWCYSMVFPLKEYIFMYWQITGAIFLGGAGSVIIGGLYWKHGTTNAAWGAMITGMVTAIFFICLRLFWKDVPVLVEYSAKMPLNGAQSSFITAICSVVVYVVVSLLEHRETDMDRILHRGTYKVAHDHDKVSKAPLRGWKKVFNITSEFTFWDKFIYFFKFGWVMFWLSAFIAGTVYSAFYDIPDDIWAKWWGFKVSVIFILSIGTTVWFLIGGLNDMFSLFKTLRNEVCDIEDDGQHVETHVEIDIEKNPK